MTSDQGLNPDYLERALSGDVTDEATHVTFNFASSIEQPLGCMVWKPTPTGGEVLVACAVPGHGVTSLNLASVKDLASASCEHQL